MRYSAIVSITLALFATTAIAAPASKLLCAIVDVFDCPGAECTEVTSEAVGVPDLVRLDPAGNSMTALDAEFDGAATKLESMTEDGGKTATGPTDAADSTRTGGRSMMSDRVARLLLERGRITRRQFDEAVRAQGFFGGELESHLLKLGHVSEDVLGATLAEHYGLPYASGDALRTIAPEARDAAPRDLLERLEACPFAVDGKTLRVAMLDPRDRTTQAEIERATGMAVEPWVTCEVRLHGALERHWRIRPRGVRPIAPCTGPSVPQSWAQGGTP